MAATIVTPGSRLHILGSQPAPTQQPLDEQHATRLAEDWLRQSGIPVELIRRLQTDYSNPRLMESTRRVSESWGTFSPWGWPSIWQYYQNSTYPGPGGFPYRGASGTTIDRQFGRDLPFMWSEVELRGYRVTSRYLSETNPLAIGFMNLLKAYHIRKGYAWQACRKGTKKGPYPTKNTTDELVKRAQEILDKFQRDNSWGMLSRESFERWRVDGEVFGKVGWEYKTIDGIYQPHIWFRFIEPEQVGAPDGTNTTPWSFGIDVQEYEDGSLDPMTPLAYWVWDMNSGMTQGEWVDAANVVHAKANVVSGVKRGRPDFFPVLDYFDGVRKLYTNVLLSACSQAAIAWVEKYPTATMSQVAGIIPQQSLGNGSIAPADGCSPGINGILPFGYRPGNKFNADTILRTEGNRQFEPGPNATGAANFELIAKMAVRFARMRWNLPGSASGDAEDTTFAAAIQAGGPFPVAVEGNQVDWGSQFERPIAMRVLRMAVACRLLTMQDYAQLDVEVTEPQVVSPEPDKDSARYKTEYDSGVRSQTTWQLAIGLDPQHEQENFEAESKRKHQTQPAVSQPSNSLPNPIQVERKLKESRVITQTGI